MTKRLRPTAFGLLTSIATFSFGCLHTNPSRRVQAPIVAVPMHANTTASSPAVIQAKPTEFASNSAPIVTVSMLQGAKPEPTNPPKTSQSTTTPIAPATMVGLPAYATLETLPIDLATVIRLTNQQSPAVEIARARTREAAARLQQAELQWVPHLTVGATYTRFDGQTQNQRGDVFGVSRANLFASGGMALTVDAADAIYRPLIERRLNSAESYRNLATIITAEYEAVSAYIDLVQSHAQLDINADTLKKAEEMLQAAKNAQQARLDRSPGDVNRAQSEVYLRRTERIETESKINIASTRLAKLLLLPANVRLIPAEIAVLPITLVDPNCSLDQLIQSAIRTRPDLASNRELVAAAWERVRQRQRGPLFPKVGITNQTGSLGGGLNNDLQDFEARNAIVAQIYWELKNFGFGNRAEVEQQQAQLDQARQTVIETQARIAAEIVEAAQIAAAKYEALKLAQESVKEATNLYRINKDGTLNVVDAKNLFDALRPLQAIQLLNQASLSYLSAVTEFNRAQYRLFTAIGQPARLANPMP